MSTLAPRFPIGEDEPETRSTLYNFLVLVMPNNLLSLDKAMSSKFGLFAIFTKFPAESTLPTCPLSVEKKIEDKVGTKVETKDDAVPKELVLKV